MIEGTHELIDLPVIVSGIPNYPEGVAALSRERLAELGETYIQRTRAYRHLGRPHFTDKRPGNFMNTGLIELMLPNAKIVDVRRHPLACCVPLPAAFRRRLRVLLPIWAILAATTPTIST